jgi:hypothetical protein
MATVVNITLFPPNTVIYVTSLANASYTQTVTLTPPSGTAATFTGSGEGNVAMSLQTQGFLSTGSGQPFFKTANSSGTYQVQISSTQGIENVQFSACTNAWTSGATANVLMVVGEDATDQDYNDSVVLFTWYTSAAS